MVTCVCLRRPSESPRLGLIPSTLGASNRQAIDGINILWTMNLLNQRDQLISIVTLICCLALFINDRRLVSLLAMAAHNSWSLSARGDVVFMEGATVNSNTGVVLVDEGWFVRCAQVVFLVVKSRPSSSLWHLSLNDIFELRVDGLRMIGPVFGVSHL